MEHGTRRRKAAQIDIAQAASVSTATVSRVLNRSPLVRPRLRARVERAMERLGYLPHAGARALASNRSGTIGALVPTLENETFVRGINALEQRLRMAERTLVIAASNYSSEIETMQVRRLLERGVDGLMLVGNVHAEPTLNLLRRAGIPIVATYIYEPNRAWPNIGFSNQAAMRRMAEHLVRLGHRDIGMFAGITQGNDRATKRLAGMREGLRRLGLELNPHATEELPYTIGAARAAFARLAKAGRLPTALACGNDILALGVLFEAAARGIRIPEDLAVAGFDNAPITAHIRPTLTTVNIPVDEMGESAAEALLYMIDTGNRARSVKLEASLLVRESTGPARQRDRGRAPSSKKITPALDYVEAERA